MQPQTINVHRTIYFSFFAQSGGRHWHYIYRLSLVICCFYIVLIHFVLEILRLPFIYQKDVSKLSYAKVARIKSKFCDFQCNVNHCGRLIETCTHALLALGKFKLSTLLEVLKGIVGVFFIPK